MSGFTGAFRRFALVAAVVLTAVSIGGLAMAFASGAGVRRIHPLTLAARNRGHVSPGLVARVPAGKLVHRRSVAHSTRRGHALRKASARLSPRAAVTGTTPSTVTVGTEPTGVAVSSTRAYVANQRSNDVSVIDITQSPPAVIATIPVGSSPDAAALSADGSRLYVPNFGGGTLSIISTSTNTVTNTVGVGKDPDGTVEVGGLVYVANLLSSSISVIDPSSGTVVRTIALPSGVAPSGLAASADGHTLYADDARNGRTYPIDLTQNPPAVGAPVSIGSGTYPAYLSVAGHTAYVAASGANKVAVLDLTQSPPALTGSVPVGSRDYGVFAVPALGEVFATNSGSNTVSVIDTSSSPGTVVSTVPTGSVPDAIAVSPDNTTAVVANEGDGTVNIYHVNQAPVNTVPGAQTVPSGESLTFSSANSNQISTADSDAGSNPVEITLSVAHGTLTLSGTSGLTFTSGSNNSGSMQFTGSLTDVNNALNGLVYQPSSGYQGSDTLSLTDNDQGNTGLGKPEASTSTVAITVSGNTPPTVGNVSYSGAIGNTTFGVGTTPPSPSTHTSGTVLSNSSDSDGDTLTAVPGTITTTQGGTVSMNSDGTFTYQPPVGFTGANDTFTFQVSDGHGNTGSGTATVAVANRVWYVNNNDATNGNGTATSPFNSLAPVNPASGSGDYIFVYGSSTSYGGGIVLKSSQTLVGQSYGLTISGVTVVPASGSNPTITNASGDGIELATNDVVEGVNVSNASANGIGASGLTGNITITSVTVSGSADDDGLLVSGTSGTLTLSVTGSTFETAAGHADQGDGLFVEPSGAAVKVTATGDTFTGNFSDGLGVVTGPSGSGALTLVANDNTVTNNTGAGIDLGSDVGTNSTGAFTISGNSLTGQQGSAINVANFGNGTWNGHVNSNTIGNPAVADSGSKAGWGIIVNQGGGSGTITAEANDNTIRQIESFNGIEGTAQQGSGTLNLTLTGNNIDTQQTGSQDGIFVNSGALSSDLTTVCMNATGNTSQSEGTAEFPATGFAISNSFAGTKFDIQGLGSSTTSDSTVETYLDNKNHLAPTSGSTDTGGQSFAQHNASGPGWTAVSSCPAPPTGP